MQATAKAALRPYYDEGGITIFHGDCANVLPHLIGSGASLLLTDPPYDTNTAKHARGDGGSEAGRGFVDRGVGSISFDDLCVLLSLCGFAMAPPAWCVATVAFQHAARLEVDPPYGWQFIRCGAWVSWNGGGGRAVWTHPIERNVKGHPTIKPLGLVKEWVNLFSDPGELVIDPFMGSGTTLRACKDTGRRAIGIETNESYCELAVKRLRQEVLFY
jgi:site-specific DNA-methyltransferase (adenine-specific)